MGLKQILCDTKNLSAEQKRRLEAAEMMQSGELTPMGKRIRNGKPTKSDIRRLQALFGIWYCHTPPKSAAKSPIDCGDR